MGDLVSGAVVFREAGDGAEIQDPVKYGQSGNPRLQSITDLNQTGHQVWVLQKVVMYCFW